MASLIFFTGESRHRYREDTLLCIGAPIGYVIKFDYKVEYLGVTLEEIRAHIGQKVLLVSYTEKITDRKWLPIRYGKLLYVTTEQQQVDFSLELRELLMPNSESFGQQLHLASNKPNAHVLKSSWKEDDVVLANHDEDFKEVYKTLKDFSTAFQGENVIFSYFKIIDAKNREISLSPSEKTECNSETIYRPQYKSKGDTKIRFDWYFFAPDIGQKSHLIKFEESISGIQPRSYEYILGTTQEHHKIPVDSTSSWLPRNGRFSLTGTSNGMTIQRPDITLKIPFKWSPHISVFLLSLFYAGSQTYDSLNLASISCFFSSLWVKPFLSFVGAIISMYIIQFFLRDR